MGNKWSISRDPTARLSLCDCNPDSILRSSSTASFRSLNHDFGLFQKWFAAYESKAAAAASAVTNNDTTTTTPTPAELSSCQWPHIVSVDVSHMDMKEYTFKLHIYVSDGSADLGGVELIISCPMHEADTFLTELSNIAIGPLATFDADLNVFIATKRNEITGFGLYHLLKYSIERYIEIQIAYAQRTADEEDNDDWGDDNDAGGWTTESDEDDYDGDDNNQDDDDNHDHDDQSHITSSAFVPDWESQGWSTSNETSTTNTNTAATVHTPSGLELPSMLRTTSHEKFSALKILWEAEEARLRSARSSGKTVFDDTEFHNVKQIFSQKEISMLLTKPLIRLMSQSGLYAPIDVSPIDNNIYCWRVRMRRFESSSDLYMGLAQLESKYGSGYNYVEIELSFDMDLFPFYPPRVKPIWPRLENAVMGRVVCLDELMVSNWNPIRQIEDILKSIRRVFRRHGSIDILNEANDPTCNGDIYPNSEFQLWRLAMLTGTSVRAGQLHSVPLTTANGASSPSSMPHAPTVRTGRFQTWGQSTQSDDVEAYVAYLAAQRQKDTEIGHVLGMVLASLAPKSISPIMLTLMEQSCIVPLIAKWLSAKDGMSIATLEKQSRMYMNLLSIVRGMCIHLSLVYLLKKLPDQSRSIQELVTELNNCIQDELSKRKDDATEPTPVVKMLQLVQLEVDTAILMAQSMQEKQQDDSKQEAASAVSMEEFDLLAPTSGTILTRARSGCSDIEPESKSLQECPLCFASFELDDIQAHAAVCDGIPLVSDVTSTKCPICMVAFPKDLITDHVSQCLMKDQLDQDAALAAALQDTPATTTTTAATAAAAATATGTSTAAATTTPEPPALTRERSVEMDSLQRKIDAMNRQFDPAHMEQLDSNGPRCLLCNRGIKANRLEEHTRNCWKCPVCSRAMLRRSLAVHVDECIQFGKLENEEKVAIHYSRQQEGICNEAQLNALLYVQQEASRRHEIALPALQQRFSRMGYGEHDLQVVLRYIRTNAPIIVHVHLERTLQYLVDDTHYRNLFETKTGSGCTDTAQRAQWEDSMFNGTYQHATPFERVKYGVLNIMKDPCGVRSAWSYGDSYMVLQNTRLRTTFACSDTGGGSAQLATCEYYAHVLERFADEELKGLYQVASGVVKNHKNFQGSGNYREIQIHGPLRLDRDVACIVANPRYRKNKHITTLLQRFVDKFHCDLLWMPE
jgi:Protein of unknown function (DUF3626)